MNGSRITELAEIREQEHMHRRAERQALRRDAGDRGGVRAPKGRRLRGRLLALLPFRAGRRARERETTSG
jgi:hypothetical protein